MLLIKFKDGDIRTYNNSEYTDYRYLGDVFVVIRGCQWIGIYSMSYINCVEFIQKEGDKSCV